MDVDEDSVIRVIFIQQLDAGLFLEEGPLLLQAAPSVLNKLMVSLCVLNWVKSSTYHLDNCVCVSVFNRTTRQRHMLLLVRLNLTRGFILTVTDEVTSR